MMLHGTFFSRQFGIFTACNFIFSCSIKFPKEVCRSIFILSGLTGKIVRNPTKSLVISEKNCNFATETKNKSRNNDDCKDSQHIIAALL